ncbi:MAG: hypothetical protein AMJ93_10410 [Anaerolineae bacterium SM23_84]|nr:MAG: hypothetical protein AMJ93_10410 [Anaerolineae bacterium SM23_84]
MTQLDDLPLVLLGLSAADWQKRHLLVTSQAAPAVPVPAESSGSRRSRGSGYGTLSRQSVLSPEPPEGGDPPFDGPVMTFRLAVCYQHATSAAVMLSPNDLG